MGVAIAVVSAPPALPTRPSVYAVTLHWVSNFLRASHWFSLAKPHALEAFTLSYCCLLVPSTLESYVCFV